VAGHELSLNDEAAELPEVPMAWIWPGEKKGVAASSWIRLQEKKGGHPIMDPVACDEWLGTAGPPSLDGVSGEERSR
jgi:hypothetical protein